MDYCTPDADGSWRKVTLLTVLASCVFALGAPAKAEPAYGRVSNLTGNGIGAIAHWSFWPSANTRIDASITADDGNQVTVYTGDLPYTLHGPACSLEVVVSHFDVDGNITGGLYYAGSADEKSEGKCAVSFVRSLKEGGSAKGIVPRGIAWTFGADGSFTSYEYAPLAFDVAWRGEGPIITNSLNVEDKYVGLIYHFAHGGRARMAAADGVIAGITLPLANLAFMATGGGSLVYICTKDC
jgi:hypothetical protein